MITSCLSSSGIASRWYQYVSTLGRGVGSRRILVKNGLFKSVAYNQVEVFEAAKLFASTEGFVPAPESAHAVKAAIDLALEAKRSGEKKVVLFNLSGHGLLDLKAYDEFLAGKLPPYEYPREFVEKSVEKLYSLYPWLKS